MQKRLKRILATYFNVNEESITKEFSSTTIKGWCSHLQAKIVFAIEKEFGIEFDESELMLADSYPLLYEVVESKLS